MVKLKTNAFYNILLTGSGLILPFVSFPYVTRILAPEGIGQINFANSFIQYFVILTSLGIPYYGIREIAKVKDDVLSRSKLLFELLTIKVVFSLVGILFYLVLVLSVAKFSDYLPYYLFGLGIIVIGIFDLNFFFYALEDFKYITLRTVFFQVFSVILTFGLIKTKEDTLVYFCIPILIGLLNTLVNTNYIVRFIDFRSVKARLNLKRHLKPLFLLFSVMIFTSIYNLLDTTLLGFLSSNSYVGYYSVASKINKIPLSIIMVLVPVMLPRISVEFGNQNYSEISRLIGKTIQFVIVLGVPIMVGLYILAPEIISLLAGTQFSPSTTTLRIMSPIVLIIGITTNYSNQLLIPMGEDVKLLYAVFWGTITSIALNLVLIPFLHHNGAAISNLIAELVVLLSCYYYVRKKIQILIPFKQIVVNSLFCLPFFAFVSISRYFASSAYLVVFFSLTLSMTYYVVLQVFILKNALILEFKEMVKAQFANS